MIVFNMHGDNVERGWTVNNNRLMWDILTELAAHAPRLPISRNFHEPEKNYKYAITRQSPPRRRKRRKAQEQRLPDEKRV